MIDRTDLRRHESPDLRFVDSFKGPNSIILMGVVTIHATGKVEFGPGVEPDEALKRFWDALTAVIRYRAAMGDVDG